MDDSDAFLLVGLSFFLLIFLLCWMLEKYRHEREDRLENRRYERMLQERREFGYERVQQSIENQKSFRDLFRNT
jgi:hypothetical protein